MHCFISKSIVERLGFEPLTILQIKMLVVETVFLRSCAMTIDLIIMDTPDFDVTLDMGFLSRYRAQIDCKKKKVRFNINEGEQFIFREG